MRKPTNSPPLPSDDPAFIKARQEWDNRLEEAATRERRMFLIAGGGLLFGLAGFGYGVRERSRALEPVVRYVEHCRDRLLAVVSADMPGELAAQDIADKLKGWVRGAREVSLDAAYMRRAIWDTYRMTEAGSAAEERLRQFHTERRPDERAKAETVVLERQTAMPDGPSSSRTWRLEWREITTGRDGRPIAAEDWRMGVTFAVRRPTTAEEIERNWTGIYVQTFHWERVRSEQVVSRVGGER